MTRVTVVVNVYNEEARIPGLLSMLEAQTYPEVRVLFVDDGSEDRTAEKIRAYQGRLSVELISLPHVGLARARLRGLRAVREGIAVVLDADMTVPPNWIESLVAEFDDPNVGGVASLVVGAGDSFAARGSRAARKVLDWVRSRSPRPWMSGGGMAIRSQALRSIDIEAHDLFAEDVVISHALVDAGWMIRRVGGPAVETIDPATLVGVWRRHWRVGRRTWWLFRDCPTSLFRLSNAGRFFPLLLLLVGSWSLLAAMILLTAFVTVAVWAMRGRNVPARDILPGLVVLSVQILASSIALVREAMSHATRQMRRCVGGPVWALSVVGGIALAVLVVLDGWFVSFDGSAYLAVAKNLRELKGPVFPDGTFMTFRGPIYPAIAAAGWTILPVTVKNGVWILRAAVIAASMSVGWLAWRITANQYAVVLAGLLTAVSPLTLIAGGWFPVPDALAWTFVVLALAIAARGSPKRIWLAGVLLALGYLTKETTLLALPLPALYIAQVSGVPMGLRSFVSSAAAWGLVVGGWNITTVLAAGALTPPLDRPAVLLLLGAVFSLSLIGVGVVRRSRNSMTGPRLPVAIDLLVVGVGIVGLLTLSGEPVRQVGELWTAFRLDLNRQLVAESPWFLALVGVVVVLVWSLTIGRRTESALQGWLLLSAGIPLMLHSVVFGGSLRNGVAVSFGLAIMSAGLVAWAKGHFAKVAWIAVASLVVGLGWASWAYDSRTDEALLTDSAPATRALADMVSETKGSVAATPLLASMMWFYGDGRPMRLLPMFLPERSTTVHWAGVQETSTREFGRLLAANVARTVTVSVYEQPLLSALRDSDWIVVTGNMSTIASAFDGGVLLPVLRNTLGVEQVWSTPPEMLPQWGVIFQVVGEPQLPDIAPQAHVAVEGTVAPSGATVYDNRQMQNIILTVLKEGDR